jgi:hypothetical protein
MEARCSSETSVDFQRITRRYVPEDKYASGYRIVHFENIWSMSRGMIN